MIPNYRIETPVKSPRTPQQQRRDAIKLDFDERCAARRALFDQYDYERSIVQQLASEVPPDSEFYGKTLAELEGVVIVWDDRRPAAAAEQGRRATQLDAARRQAASRDRMALLQTRMEVLATETAALSRLLNRLDTYLRETQ
jgi:hypothetical protein